MISATIKMYYLSVAALTKKKVNLSLSTYRGRRGTTPLILHLGTGWT